MSFGRGPHCLLRMCQWLVGRPLPSQGSRVEFGAGPWVVFEQPYLRATEEVGPRGAIWFGTECLLPWSAFTQVHGVTHLCTYPDLFLYIPLLCFRVAMILDRCVL